MVEDWDDETQRAALRQAQAVSHRDPEAAALLAAHVVASQELQEKRGELVSRTPTGYNPRQIYSYMCKEYGWTPRDIDEMHYITFFAMLHETNERNLREQEAMKAR